jgi:DNA-binding CsgD family transcriptional regulator
MFRLFTNAEKCDLLDLVADFKRCSDIDDLHRLIRKTENIFSFDFYHILLIDVPNESIESIINAGYPKEFEDRFMEQKYYKYDPVAMGFIASDTVFYWGDVDALYEADETTMQIKDEAESLGIVDGVSYSFDFNKYKVVPNFVSEVMLSHNDAVRNLSVLKMIGEEICRFSAKQFSLKLKDQLNLSEKQYEALCLYKTAMKRSQIAEKMQISPKTVDAHLDQASKKLGARNRGELLVMTYELGLFPS